MILKGNENENLISVHLLGNLRERGIMLRENIDRLIRSNSTTRLIIKEFNNNENIAIKPPS